MVAGRLAFSRPRAELNVLDPETQAELVNAFGAVELIGEHQLQRLGFEQATTLELPPIHKHLAEVRVVAHCGHQPASAGEELEPVVVWAGIRRID